MRAVEHLDVLETPVVSVWFLLGGVVVTNGCGWPVMNDLTGRRHVELKTREPGLGSAARASKHHFVEADMPRTVPSIA